MMKRLRLRKAGISVAIILIFLSVALTWSCQKEKGMSTGVPSGQQRVQIRLSDGPVNFDAVNVDIQRVEVLVLPDSCHEGGHNSGDDHENGDSSCYHDHDGDGDHHQYSCAVWDTLDIRPGVYNLLNLSNGTDTLLASGLTVAGQIRQIRLILGTNNSVVVDSVSYPLTLLNGSNRVTINIRGEDIEEITPGDLQLWLDFDAARSIERVHNNQFVLNPYLRIWLPSQTASIKGKVLPGSADAIVSAVSNGDTLVAIPEGNGGRFKIRGLKGTSATVLVNATANNYQDTTIVNVPLQRGHETDLGTIQLHQ